MTISYRIDIKIFILKNHFKEDYCAMYFNICGRVLNGKNNALKSPSYRKLQARKHTS